MMYFYPYPHISYHFPIWQTLYLQLIIEQHNQMPVKNQTAPEALNYRSTKGEVFSRESYET